MRCRCRESEADVRPTPLGQRNISPIQHDLAFGNVWDHAEVPSEALLYACNCDRLWDSDLESTCTFMNMLSISHSVTDK